MKNNVYYAIGVMSGSSLDGLDVVYCKFEKGSHWSFKILAEAIFELREWENKLNNARQLSNENLDKLDIAFGSFIGNCVQEFMLKNNISNLDIIASHGHTIYHFPERGLTKQIGLGSKIFEKINKPILTNLRQKDIDAGGNGAPIVPIGDLHLFSEYKYCLNIGGIANISKKDEKNILAFDICSANQILNKLVEERGLKYDNKGSIAKGGELNTELFNQLNSIDFYTQKAPKSLDNSFSDIALHIISAFNISLEDKLCTYCHHIAFQIAETILKPEKEAQKMLVTGGGAFNTFLIALISEKLKEKKIEVVIPSKEIIDNKEALVMAFMSVLYLRNEVNVLASATGARRDTVCGEYFYDLK